MKVVILAGGLGTRLHPATVNLPKPMVPVANRPLMSYTIELLARHGLTDVCALLYHQPEIIRDFFKDGSGFGVRMSYFQAEEDFGTAGAVRFACKEIKEPILVMSADLITGIDLSSLVAFHRQKNSFATMALTRVENPLPYGIVITGEDGRISKFLEKPSWGEVFSDTINAGIYVLEPEALSFIPDEKNFDFSLDLFPLLLAENKPLYGFVSEGFWKDIGKLEDYGRVHYDVLRGKAGSVPENRQKVRIAASASLSGHCLVGENSVISDRASLTNVIVGRDCRIGAGAALRECVIWDGVEIGAEARLERAIVCHGARIRDRAELGEGVVVGEGTEIGSEAVIKPFIKIWPNKVVERGAIVSRSIIWREHWSRSVFGQYGVSGVIGTEITPQFAAALGAAYGTVLGKGVKISCSRDGHKASRMIYRALISGVLSAGVDISDLEIVPIPINRYEVRSLKSQGGFHVRKSPFDPELIDIKFFDSDGMDLSPSMEKRIERIFFAEDFVRTTIEDTGELSYPLHRVAEEYEADIFACLDRKAIASAGLKLVIGYSFGAASQIFPSILGDLKVDAVALDAYIDETKITKDRETFERSLRQVSQMVKSTRADLGVMLDTGGEKIFICDENGEIVDGSRALALMSLLVWGSHPGAAIAVPLKETRAVEQIAAHSGGRVARTKNTFREMMEIADQGGVSFAGEGQGGFIYPECFPCFDAMLSTCKLMEYLAKEKKTLSRLLSEVPEINLLEREIACPSELKGKIMRGAVERIKEVDRVETIDGLKFWENGAWALILPDPTRPVIHLCAEADSREKTQKLLDKYTVLINELKGGIK